MLRAVQTKPMDKQKVKPAVALMLLGEWGVATLPSIGFEEYHETDMIAESIQNRAGIYYHCIY